ncbi:protein PYRICULARIA ORYZAE RESISTANCE 21-like isoform X2 [Olea europaea var. sylvestris]|uniref:Neurofilament heavy polypeptide-like n=1 Tax=Olea europaea subsp. europaea TaxID=158383 RepID=A0A8S0RC32_OLEEU|nr:protein PYRICULARIA ORYZAE RESISTANCE 21-like isoform X1 [Olea europaea var. sylvestris]XP_022895662.1 protein PYRICULARIA ORYZAE RESISTANCE 21-like isoform X2 [Olea europaea var. sylvestris]CAA2976495.1 neurofilament heavy polypeptide-like [Olea europaea subsp. europaea]
MAEPEKKTVMVLKVDLQCPSCFEKIRKILCRIPQIRDRWFDEKANTVKITVICCSPEKIRDKLCSKGGKIIKCIEIEEPGPESNGNGNAPPLAPGPLVGLALLYPVNPCCRPCCEGYGGGPCFHGYGFPPPLPQPQPRCDGNYACGPGYIYGRSPCCVPRRCDYFTEEDTTSCKFM